MKEKKKYPDKKKKHKKPYGVRLLPETRSWKSIRAGEKKKS
jgi:hypothetical protein